MDDETEDVAVSEQNEKREYTKCDNSSKMSKKMVETRDLINAVQRRKCLWDRQHPAYRDRLAKDKAWKEICREVEPSYNSLTPSMRYELSIQMTKKWYNVRDAYVKSRRNSRASRPYIYAESLSFLDSIYFGEGNSSHINHETYIEDKISNEDEAESSENWINEVFIDVDESMTEGSKRARLDFTPKVKEETDDSDHNVINVLANLIQKEEDEDRAFFKSITPSVKKLSHDAKLEFRIQVLKLIKILNAKDKKRLVKKEIAYSDSD